MKFIETDSEWRVPEAGGKENGELVFNWYGVSVWGDEYSGDGWW